MKLLALILASGLATSLVGCATDSGSEQPDTQEAMLLGTWMGNFHTTPTQFSFEAGGRVTETELNTDGYALGTYVLVDGQLTLDFGDGADDFVQLHVTVTEDSLTFVDSHESMERLSGCGVAPEL